MMAIISLAFFNTSFAKTAPVKKKAAKAEPVKKVIPKFDRTTLKGQLLAGFYHLGATKDSKKNLKKKVISAGGKAVPALVEVMKKDIYPDNARWLATLMLGRVRLTLPGLWNIQVGFLEWLHLKLYWPSMPVTTVDTSPSFLKINRSL
jgi:hypothetical protein